VTAQVIIAGHAFMQNLRRGHYELGVHIPASRRVAATFTELALRSDPEGEGTSTTRDPPMQQHHRLTRGHGLAHLHRGDQLCLIIQLHFRRPVRMEDHKRLGNLVATDVQIARLDPVCAENCIRPGHGGSTQMDCGQGQATDSAVPSGRAGV
jgi:hypothetical protein